MERLDLEVEPLDSLFGIDRRLPESADEFRERSAELRLAWAAAADWPPAVDLLLAQRRRAIRLMLIRAAAIAGLAAALSVVAWAMDSQSRQASAPRRSSQAQPAAGGQAPASAPSPPTPPLLPLTSISEEQRPQPTPQPVTPAQMVVAPKPEPLPPRPLAAPAAPPRTVAPPAAGKPAAPAGRRGPREVRQPPPTPFDAALETILYSPDRRLALIDGRIVQIGDVVRGATIVDITPTTVLLRDSAGRPRSLSLEGRR